MKACCWSTEAWGSQHMRARASPNNYGVHVNGNLLPGFSHVLASSNCQDDLPSKNHHEPRSCANELWPKASALCQQVHLWGSAGRGSLQNGVIVALHKAALQRRTLVTRARARKQACACWQFHVNTSAWWTMSPQSLIENSSLNPGDFCTFEIGSAQIIMWPRQFWILESSEGWDAWIIWAASFHRENCRTSCKGYSSVSWGPHA